MDISDWRMFFFARLRLRFAFFHVNVVPTITTYRKVGAFYIAFYGDVAPAIGNHWRKAGKATTEFT
jgi:hypothetical protein